jgi:ankyrin repeat protein
VRALAAKGKSSLDFSMRTPPYRPLLTAAALRSRPPEQEAQKLAMMDLILTLEPSPLDTSADGRNAFYAAADGYSSAAVFERLVKLGVDINKPNNYGRTPLFAIGPFASEQAVRTQSILVSLGANPNQQNNDGQTPLVHAFAWSGASDVTIAAMVARLLEAGADPNIADSSGRTALNFAAMRPMPDTVDLLIAKGAKLGPTPRYETSTLDFVRNRIADIERAPSREADCSCLADYKRVLAALDGIVS